jgi:glycogen operon protein
MPDIHWHGTKLDTPPWGDPDARFLAFTLAGLEPDEPHLHVMLNMWTDPLDFAVPPAPGRRWYQAIDTAQAPYIWSLHDQTSLTRDGIRVAARSIVVLEAR